MKLTDVTKKFRFSSEEAAEILDTALQCSTVMGKELTLEILSLASTGSMGKLPEEVEAQDRVSRMVCEHPWTWENVATLAEKVAPLVDYFTFEGLLARISPLLRGLDVQPMSCDTRRPCLVHNRKHWFLRWQDRKWICEPSPMKGGHEGGQCQVTMAIVEDQETGQVAEVYPRDVRFIDNQEFSPFTPLQKCDIL